MSRYIDAIPFAQAVFDLRNKEREEYDNLAGKHRSLARSIHSKHVEFCNKMLDIIRKQPTVDAVPVVLCRDCKYRKESVDGLFKSGYFCERCHFSSDMENCDDFYCANGERKSDETEGS
jgi:hypothetical protein